MEGAQSRCAIEDGVDSSVPFDIVKGAPDAGAAQASLEAALAIGSLCVCAALIAELGRYFSDQQNLKDFLAACQIEHDRLSTSAAMEAARTLRACSSNDGPRERVAADFLIGAHAINQAGALLTTDTSFSRHYFDSSQVITPQTSRCQLNHSEGKSWQRQSSAAITSGSALAHFSESISSLSCQ